jgi:hypothetical protein
MAMDGELLGAALMQAIDDAVAVHPTAGTAQRTEIWKKIGIAIVTHVRLATVTVTVASVSGVTPGGGVSGPGTGSGSVT